MKHQRPVKSKIAVEIKIAWATPTIQYGLTAFRCAVVNNGILLNVPTVFLRVPIWPGLCAVLPVGLYSCMT